MSWKETNKVEQRQEFINRMLTEKISFTKLCEEFEISRKTGYKWKQRFDEGGYSRLKDVSKKPHNNSNEVNEDDIIRIIQMKSAHKNWGPKKIKSLLEGEYRQTDVPSISSIYRILSKAELVEKKRKKRVDTSAETLRNMIQPEEPNDVWSVDFKGWWKNSKGERVNPLTIRDEKSKYIIDIQVLKTQGLEGVKEVFEKVFHTYGLPKIIRSDNGTPFAASRSLMGLSRLSAWWVSLDILPDRIDPGKPYQNGAHERMHRDMKKEIQKYQTGELEVIQNVLTEWKNEYNEVRPHEALGMKVPASVYTKSVNKYMGDIDEFIYPTGMDTRKIMRSGMISIKGKEIIVANVLEGYRVGLDNVDDNLFKVWLCNLYLGDLDTRLYKFYPRDKI